MMGDIVFGEALRRSRERFGISQEELGRRVGVSRVTIGEWERGLTQPQFDSFGKICHALGWVCARNEDGEVVSAYPR